jgi:hypothetical protein
MNDVRWGAQELLNVQPGALAPAGSVVSEFLNLDLPCETVIRLRLEAFADAPVAGLAITWHVYIGGGSTMQRRDLTGTVTPTNTLAALEMDLPLKTLRVGCTVTNTNPGPRFVTVSAFSAPYRRG